MSIKSLKLEIFLTIQFKHMFRVLKRTVSMSTHNLFWLSNKKFGTQLKTCTRFWYLLSRRARKGSDEPVLFTYSKYGYRLMPKFRLLAWLDTSAHAIRGGFCKYIRPVDLRDSDLGSGDKKSSENDQLTGHFQSFFFISPEQTVKIVR